jgi:hypothetical protein
MASTQTQPAGKPPAAKPAKQPPAQPAWGTSPGGNGQVGGAYRPSGGGKHTRRDLAALQYGAVADPEGHVKYCAGIIAEAKASRGGVTEQTGAFAAAVKLNPGLNWALRRYVVAKMRRADRRLAAALEAVAKEAARKAKTRQDVDQHVLEELNKAKGKAKAGAYRPGR